MLYPHSLDDELDEEERAMSEYSSARSYEGGEELQKEAGQGFDFDEEEEDEEDTEEQSSVSRRDVTLYRGVLLTIHSIDEARVMSRPMYAELVAASMGRMMAVSDCVTWIDLSEESATAALIAEASDRKSSLSHKLHPVALRALARAAPGVSYSPQVQALGYGWTLWTAMLPSCSTEKRVTFVAACSERLVLTRICVGDEDSPPVGGWWKSRRPSFNNNITEAQRDLMHKIKKEQKQKSHCFMANCFCCRNLSSEQRLSSSEHEAATDPLLRGAGGGVRASATTATTNNFMNDSNEDRGRRRRRPSDDTQTHFIFRGSNDQEVDGSQCEENEAPSGRYLKRLLRDDDERERIVRLGGPYMCAKIIATALFLARENFSEFDDTISQLTHVCTDEKPGWRHERVRFNRTVGMLLEAGKARAHIARLREYYEQCYQLARSAAHLYSTDPALTSHMAQQPFQETHISDDDRGDGDDNARPSSLVGSMTNGHESHVRRQSNQSDISQSSFAKKKKCMKQKRRSAAELGPWIRDLLNTSHADTRRLHQQDNLLHSYIVLARLRHEDDYQRVNVLLSLIATIFLPLSFLSGVWGMNFKHLPLTSYRWTFSSFLCLSASIVFFAIFLFWYRGWLNVARPVTSKFSSLHTLDQDILPLYQPPRSNIRRHQSSPSIGIV